MNKILLSGFVCLTLAAAPVYAGLSAAASEAAPVSQTVQQEDIYKYEVLSDNTVRLTSLTAGSDEAVIPETIDGMAVTEIGEYAVSSRGLVSVKIPKTVTVIEDKAIGYLSPELSGGVEPVKVEGLKILCFDGSAAHKYAAENGFEAVLHSHTFKSVSKTAPTCTKEGSETFECTECGERYTKVIARTAHNFIKVGTKAPTLTSQGYNIYICTVCSEEKHSDFTAALKSIAKATVTNVKAGYTYTGKAVKPEPKITYGGTVLKKGTDYTLTYASNTKKGTAKLTIKGKGKYAGTKTVTYKITAASITKAKVSGFGSYKKYTGQARTQPVTLSFGGKALKNGTDYTVSYKNNTERGTAQLIIKGKGNFSGTLTKKFKIVRMGWFKYKGNYYYYSNKGKKYVSGSYKIGSSYYCFSKNGVMLKGWQRSGNDYYYYDRGSGKRLAGKTVDGIKLAKNGKAVLNDYARSKIGTMIKARKIMLSITNATDSAETKRLKCFNWVMSFPYRQYRLLRPIMRQDGWEVLYANDIFDNHQGCCVSESSATAFLFREIGYTDVWVCHDSSHAWVMVGRYLFDPLFAESRSFSQNYNAIPSDYRVTPTYKVLIG